MNNIVMYRLVRETVRIIDAIDRENQYLFEKHPQHHNLIDSKARKAFPKGLIAAALK